MLTRRGFAFVASAGAMAGAEPITAAAAIRKIQEALGGSWESTGPDGLKAGDADTPVKGMVTTAMATLDVLKQAVRSKANFIVTYEPTFYSRADGTGIDPNDPVLKAKHEFIEKNGLVVFRLRDHWQARRQDDMVRGLAEALGWANHVRPDDATLFDIPPAASEATVAAIRTRLKLRAGLRAVGDRRATVRRVMLFPGSMTPAVMWRRYSEVDMIVAGEVREWENTHYAADMFAAGEKRTLVTTGRVASEDPGMRMCADWLRTVVTEVPSQWIGVGDPYWRPAA